MEPVAVFAYRVPPERMKRLRFAPTDLAGLAAMLGERGIDLCADLGARLASALTEGEAAASPSRKIAPSPCAISKPSITG